MNYEQARERQAKALLAQAKGAGDLIRFALGNYTPKQALNLSLAQLVQDYMDDCWIAVC